MIDVSRFTFFPLGFVCPRSVPRIIRDHEAELFEQLGYPPSDQQLSERTGISLDDVARARNELQSGKAPPLTQGCGIYNRDDPDFICESDVSVVIHRDAETGMVTTSVVEDENGLSPGQIVYQALIQGEARCQRCYISVVAAENPIDPDIAERVAHMQSLNS